MPRPRKPTELHRLEGTFRKGRHGGPEPEPPGAVPACPPELDELARAEWERLAPLLAGLGLLTDLDRGVLALYCQSWSRWCQAERVIAAEGVIVATPRGFKQKNPAVNIGNEAAKLMERAASHFGLLSGSRGRVTAVPHHRRRPDPLLGGEAGRDAFAELIGEDPAEAFFA